MTKPIDIIPFGPSLAAVTFQTTEMRGRVTAMFPECLAGIQGITERGRYCGPVIDALIDKVIAAESRPALIAACKALDCVIRSGRYRVPHWYNASHWLAVLVA